MIHDPLCRRAKITEVFMEGCPECALIAKVREDEGNRYVGMKAHWDSSGMPDPPPLPPSTGVPTNPMWPLRKERK